MYLEPEVTSLIVSVRITGSLSTLPFIKDNFKKKKPEISLHLVSAENIGSAKK